MAWLSGLKTTYYLRALGATHAEKSTLDRGTLNAVSSGQDSGSAAATAQAQVPEAAPVSQAVSQAVTQTTPPASVAAPDLSALTPQDTPLACSLDDPDCEACQ